MKPAGFVLETPGTLEEALSLLAEHGDDAKVLSGGQSLVPMLALRLTRFEYLIDINRIEGLAGASQGDGWVRIGATTRHRAVERDPIVTAELPLLARATAHVGHLQIRNRGTVVGAVAHADSAAEHPAVALALDATMEVVSSAGRREIPASEFFEGTWTTALAADEILAAVRFPTWAGRTGFAVEEVARRHGDFALVGVVAGVGIGASGSPDRAAIGLFGVGATPVRAVAAEQALLDGASPEDVGAVAAGEIDPSDDLHASARWRRKVAAVLVERALGRALREAGHG